MAELTQQFPTPRVQTDDGNQDVSDLHAREDLLLDHYTRIDGQAGKVRIPIERAMELIAQRGLPVVAPGAERNADGGRSPAGGAGAPTQAADCPTGAAMGGNGKWGEKNRGTGTGAKT